MVKSKHTKKSSKQNKTSSKKKSVKKSTFSKKSSPSKKKNSTKTHKQSSSSKELSPIEAYEKKKIKKIHQRPVFWTLLFFILLALALTYLIFVKAKFLLDNEMHIEVSPLDPVISATNNKSPQLTFDVEVFKPAFCTASCSFVLEDLSTNTLIAQDEKNPFVFDSFTYDIPIDEYGEGQKMYTYTVKCHNIKRGLCSSDEHNFTKTALVTANFYPTDLEIQQRELAYTQIFDFVNELSLLNEELNASRSYKKTLNTVVQSPDSTLIALQDQLFLAQSLFASLKEDKNTVLDIWQDQQFAKVLDDVDMLMQPLNQTKTISSQLYTSTNYLYTSLQEFLQTLHDIVSQKQLLNRAWHIAHEKNNTDKEQAITSFVASVNNDYEALATNSVSAISSYVERVNTHAQNFTQLINQTKEELYQATQTIAAHTTYYTNLVQEFSLASSPVSTQSLAQNDTLLNSCSTLQARQDTVALHNSTAQLYRQNNYPFLELSTELDQVLDDYLVHVKNQMSSSTVQPFEVDAMYSSVPTDYSYTLTNGTVVTTYDLTTIPEMDLRRMTTIPWNESTQELQTLYCEQVNNTPYMLAFTQETIPTLQLQPASPLGLNITIPQPQKRCCVFGDCQPCCEDDECEELYPVILVHGHSFYEGNSPELAFTRLAKLQEALSDYGYINAGQISRGSQLDGVPNGMWGIMPHPISVRVTYYYTAFQSDDSYDFITQKSDNIQTYALRLNDMIELVKERTGREKVVLIAHSMGGLVTRSYIDVFGEDSVDKLILLGTPNYGIQGDVDRLCSLTGGNKECEDMSAGSVFLSNLNSEENYLTQTDTYTITAHGCEMKSNTGKEDGDGVVLAQSVPLPFAENYHINGTCTDIFGTDLHMRFVNPEEFPETLDLVVDFLEE